MLVAERSGPCLEIVPSAPEGAVGARRRLWIDILCVSSRVNISSVGMVERPISTLHGFANEVIGHKCADASRNTACMELLLGRLNHESEVMGARVS
eukprot:2073850-Pleurochrysis_carterae.AAC.2